MSVETDPVPPVPEHSAPLREDQFQPAEGKLISQPWARWFTSLREKINVINSFLVSLGNLTGTGIVVSTGGTALTRTIQAGAGIDVADGDGVAADPTISHGDTSTVTDFTSDNSNGVVLQDITVLFDVFGHVESISVGTVDLDTRYDPAGSAAAIITQTITNGDTTHTPSGDAVFDALALKFDKTGGTISGNVTVIGFVNIDQTGLGSLAQCLLSSDAGIAAYQIFRTANSNRWFFGKFNDAESGGDTGSDFVLVRCSDAGVQTIALRVDRATGNIQPGVTNAQNLGASSARWSNIYGTNFRPGTGTPIWTSGSGSPEGAVTAAVGSLYTRTDGGAGTTLYVKESGAGNTGWIAK